VRSHLYIKITYRPLFDADEMLQCWAIYTHIFFHSCDTLLTSLTLHTGLLTMDVSVVLWNPLFSWFRCGSSPRSNCCLEFESRRHRWLVVLMCLSRCVARWFAPIEPFLGPHVGLHLQPVQPHIAKYHLQPSSALMVVHCNHLVALVAFCLSRLNSGDFVGFIWVPASEWAPLRGSRV
jgi:hypothetical protein